MDMRRTGLVLSDTRALRTNFSDSGEMQSIEVCNLLVTGYF